MEMLKKLSGKTLIEPGEELLHKEYKFANAPGRTEEVLAVVDGGSTQTRGILLDLKNLTKFESYLDQVFTIPSMSAAVLDNREIEPKGETLYDRLDSSIVNLEPLTDAIFRQIRLVRGSKFLDVEMTENRLGSSTQKTSDPTYYYNLIDNLGYQCMVRYGSQVPEKIKVFLGVSLPPDDLNKKNQEFFRENLKSFKWSHVDSGVKIEFEFAEVYTMTEPEAYVKAYYTLSGQETPDFVLHLEAGGRSIGAEILRYGKSLKGGQKTLTFGGTQLLELLADLYVEEYGGAKPKREVLEEAIRTGKVRYGNSTRDVVPLISKAKAEMATRIFTETRREVFDVQSKVAMTDLNVISVSGRMLDGGEYGVSIADFLKERFKEVTPHSDFLHVEGNYIPQGLLINSILDFFEDELNTAIQEAASAAEEQAPEA